MSVAVVPVTLRFPIPGSERVGRVATPPEGVEMRVCGTPFGAVAPAMPESVLAVPTTE